MEGVFVKAYAAPPVDHREIWRYAGAAHANEAQQALLQACLAELSDQAVFRVCYREFPISCEGDTVDLSFAKVTSPALARCLAGCGSAVVFAATVGTAIDRLITRYSAVSPARALLLDAIGTERVEALCDVFCRELAAEKGSLGLCTRPRFSPGYGDLALSLQREIFGVLDCPRKIGLSLGQDLIMSPSKSVTAIVGIGNNL